MPVRKRSSRAIVHDHESPSKRFFHSAFFVSRNSSARIAPSAAGFAVWRPMNLVGSPRTAAHQFIIESTDSVKFFKSPAEIWWTFASVDAIALIAVKYASHTGRMFPSRSLNASEATPDRMYDGSACDSAPTCMFVTKRAIPSVRPITSVISERPVHDAERRRFRNMTAGTTPRPCRSRPYPSLSVTSHPRCPRTMWIVSSGSSSVPRVTPASSSR